MGTVFACVECCMHVSRLTWLRQGLLCGGVLTSVEIPQITQIQAAIDNAHPAEEDVLNGKLRKSFTLREALGKGGQKKEMLAARFHTCMSMRVHACMRSCMLACHAS